MIKIKILREWNSDGSVNYMPIDAAVANLRRNGHGGTPARRIIEDLLAGEVYCTRLACFVLSSGPAASGDFSKNPANTLDAAKLPA